MNIILLFESDFSDSGRSMVALTGRRKDHALSVFRAAAGDTLRVGLLNGRLGTGKVRRMTGQLLEMDVALETPPPDPLPLTLILALPRPKALKRCIEAVTAFGVKKMFIIQSYRVEKSYWSSPAISAPKLREHMILGLEQACDTVLPSIETRRRFKPFVEDEMPAIVKGTRALAAHPQAPATCPCHVDMPVTLAIGPEGGFIPYEIGLFQKQGFEPVSLGKRILRVEHAIPALIGRLF
ncbi:MAG: 16S rRNA (uracil(1498)-N(3))-methyltransferase [Chitinispirillaceae bacterium]|nr:16S rRNA (uracil(1498)-N(3))-methyltransferase [Chitinispirillaceae bacterium]